MPDYSGLTADWQALLARRAALAEPLRFWTAILEGWVAWKPPAALEPLVLSAEECRQRWQAGGPLLMVDATPVIPAASVEDLLGPVMERLAADGPEAAAALRRFAEAWDDGQVGPAALIPGLDRDPAAALQERFGLGSHLGAFLPVAALRPALETYFEGVRELPELLEHRQVTALFQPMVSLPSGALAGYEALGRGLHPRLPADPLELFRIAAAVGAEAELSRLFRETALALVRERQRFPALFLNIHPSELDSPTLVPDLVMLRERLPQLQLTLDIHEAALGDRAGIDRLSAQLKRARVWTAYDDFGAGQARLLELAEVPPNFLKFDMLFVRGIDTAPRERQQLLTSLVSVARDLLVYTVAEGVETAQEADVCMRIGFNYAQGFHFGRPRPISET